LAEKKMAMWREMLVKIEGKREADSKRWLSGANLHRTWLTPSECPGLVISAERQEKILL
jgi:hypothetical protein